MEKQNYQSNIQKIIKEGEAIENQQICLILKKGSSIIQVETKDFYKDVKNEQKKDFICQIMKKKNTLINE